MQALFNRFLCGLLGGGLVTTSVLVSPAAALTEEEILEKMASVPVFVVADRSGGYVTSVADFPGDGVGNIALLRVFFEEADARTFVEQARARNPRFNQGGSVGLIDLATVHRIASEERDVPIRLLFVPQTEDLAAAREIDNSFGGRGAASIVPLFKIQDGAGNPIALPFGDEASERPFGMFFSKDDADGTLQSIVANQPDLTSQLSIGVISLSNLRLELLNNDDDESRRVEFLPDSEVINYIQEQDFE